MTQFKPLNLQEGVEAVVTTTSGYLYTATSLDIQSIGVMVDYLDNSAPKRSLVPWSRVAAITQNIQE